MSTLSFARRGDYTSVFMGVRVPQLLRTRLEDLAEAEGVSLSEVVRVLLEAGLALAQENPADQVPTELSPK